MFPQRMLPLRRVPLHGQIQRAERPLLVAHVTRIPFPDCRHPKLFIRLQRPRLDSSHRVSSAEYPPPQKSMTGSETGAALLAVGREAARVAPFHLSAS